ncbi:MAG: PTS mannose transporter subunit IIAB [Gammaproteobacteria bacterium]|nr:MAG: PTS mannose transporter subunit IIAB [Gammaproteobacteria bacterium]
MTTGIIVCGHGHFATGIASTVGLIAGEQDDFKAVDFNGSDDLSVLLQQAIDELNCEQLIIFTDILGGAPFRQASLIAGQRDNCEVVAGVTPAMLIEACLERDDYDDLSESVDELIDSGREGVTCLRQQLGNKASSAASDDDGI